MVLHAFVQAQQCLLASRVRPNNVWLALAKEAAGELVFESRDGAIEQVGIRLVRLTRPGFIRSAPRGEAGAIPSRTDRNDDDSQRREGER